MQAYKSQLRRRLAEHGWEVAEVTDTDAWWADEFWKVQSRRNRLGLELVLTFLVNPLWDAPRKKGRGVWAVSATREVPADRPTAEQGVAERDLAMCIASEREVSPCCEVACAGLAAAPGDAAGWPAPDGAARS